MLIEMGQMMRLGVSRASFVSIRRVKSSSIVAVIVLAAQIVRRRFLSVNARFAEKTLKIL